MRTTFKWLSLLAVFAMLLAVLPASVRAAQPQSGPQAACALLDDAKARGLMSAMFERRLLEACGRLNELGAVASEAAALRPALLGTDVMVNNPAGDSGVSQTQSETSIAVNENTGVICSGYNDSYSGVITGKGFTGFSRSADGGATFTDQGAINLSYGDPSVVWRKSDGLFYFASLYNPTGLGLWKSTDECQTVTFVSKIRSGYDDKELMVVDNNPTSPYYGRFYVAWTDFGAGGVIRLTYSDNGTTWSNPITLSQSGISVQGAWPVVAPNGDLYVGWVRWDYYYTGTIDIEISRSTNGGVSATRVTNPMDNKTNPYNTSATNYCGRPALNGKIRYLPSPQLVVAPDGALHVVYSYDPDGRNVGDVVNVYYRKSTDNGATWGAEIQLNDDGTLTDQFVPTLSAGASGLLASTWYDRRLDPAGNLLFDYYVRTSADGGVTWDVSTRVSDVSSPVYLDPNLATCYHGDYDQQLQYNGQIYIQWSDDRSIHSGHQDPDVWFDKGGQLVPDFSLSVTPESQTVCAPGATSFGVDVGSIMGYSSPVTLSYSGLPAGSDASFDVNPVTPPGGSNMAVSVGAVAAGSYPFTVIGTSADFTHTDGATLTVFDAVPGATTLVSPPNGATNVKRRPTLSWNAAAQADSYILEVATDPLFAHIVFTTVTTATTFTSPVRAPSLVTFYWRIMTSNVCGMGSYSEAFSFTTR